MITLKLLRIDCFLTGNRESTVLNKFKIIPAVYRTQPINMGPNLHQLPVLIFYGGGYMKNNNSNNMSRKKTLPY